MHELSLCHQIHRVVDRAAAGRPVSVVHVQVGRLRQVRPDTLRYCWTIVSDGTRMSGSILDVESVPVTAQCRRCGHVTAIGNVLVLVCAACQGAELDIKTGEEFLITSLDLMPENAEA